jgi:hypothetical protein
MGFSTQPLHRRLAATTGLTRSWQLSPSGDSDSSDRSPLPLDWPQSGREDLPYRVELWDSAGQIVEQVLAVTSHGSIGYAAYFAATREYPDRLVTLRHKNRTVARSGGSAH